MMTDHGISFAQLAGAVDRAPVRLQRRGDLIRATLTLPVGPGGRPRTYRATVSLSDVAAASSELGWVDDELGAGRFRRRLRRRLRRGVVGKLARGIVKVAKRAAKSKILRAAWKTMPIWANLVPPPAGQAIAAGAAGAQAAMKIARAAKRGHAGAKAFLRGARNLKRSKVRAIVRARKVAVATRSLPRPQRREAVARALNASGVYLVRTPAGGIVKVPASRLRA